MPPAGFDLEWIAQGPQITRYGLLHLWTARITPAFSRAWADRGWSKALDRGGYHYPYDGGFQVAYWVSPDPKEEARRAREVRRIDHESRVLPVTPGRW